MNDEVLAEELREAATGSQLITVERTQERLYFLVNRSRMHRSKLMAWWRRAWIELEEEQVHPTGRKRLWSLTESGLEAIKGTAKRD